MERSFWTSIRGKLLSRTLLVVVVPLLVLGGAAIFAVVSLSRTADDAVAEARSTLADDVVGLRVADASEQIAREVALFVDERLADVEGWSSDPGLIAGARAASTRVRQLGLDDLPTRAVESQFDAQRRLGDVAVAQDLSAAVAAEPAFTEILITEAHGFTVDTSNPGPDFVQSDEDWWMEAMDAGVAISAPQRDASTGLVTVDIAVRLDDGDEPVGVLRAALDLAVIQDIADRYTGGADALAVSIVDPQNRFLAETSSEHDPSHILSSAYVASDEMLANPAITEGLSGDRSLHPEGFSIFDDRVGGYAHVEDILSDLRNAMSGVDLSDSTSGAFEWLVVVEQPAEVAFASLAPLEQLAADVSSTSSGLTILLVGIAVAGALAAATMALVLGRRIGTPIARLRDAVVKAAKVTLPEVVSRIDEDGEVPQLEPLVLETGDEVEDLAQSFNTMQQTAAELASEQARLRRKNVSTTFVNLGRRNQNLLSRQLEHINSMENSETDAQTLQRLFKLDHLATRMRRNAESLLVLAGEETPRRFREPVPMHQLLQAAGGEIEDYGRIELASIDQGAVEGSVASDVAHLLAELLENASSFSPPGSPIQVHGRRRSNGYALAIIDQGIGMGETDMAGANARLADPAEFDRAPSAYLGHFVVGHLARRHGIRVRLAESPYGGVTAQLHLPADLLVAPPMSDRMPMPSVPASEMHDDASPDTHVAGIDNDTARELAEIADLEAALAVDLPEVPPVPTEPEVHGWHDGTEDLFDQELDRPFDPPIPFVDPDPVAGLEPITGPVVDEVASAADTVIVDAEPVAGPEPVAERGVDDSFDQWLSPPPSSGSPTEPQPADQAVPTLEMPVASGWEAYADRETEALPSAAQPAGSETLETEVTRIELTTPRRRSTLRPSTEDEPAPIQPASIEPGGAETIPIQPASTEPGGNVDTTPSGFRRRRRGHEGAPGAMPSPGPTPAPRRPAAPSRRSPEEVQASLARFRRGMESGRAHAQTIDRHATDGSVPGGEFE